jgi:hypothetical protein
MSSATVTTFVDEDPAERIKAIIAAAGFTWPAAST